jgi:lipid A 3-O-deacylase
MQKRSLLLALAGTAFACAAHAADWTPGYFYVAPGGLTSHGTTSLTAGVAWAPFWKRTGAGGEWTAHAEGFVSWWNAPQVAGSHRNFWQAGLLPVLRYRFGNGSSPLFAEASIGATFMDDVYTSRRKTFSTRFQFQDTLGVGMSLGARREHEVGLRFSHFSNAGIKHPNPGENFVQLRYAHAF